MQSNFVMFKGLNNLFPQSNYSLFFHLLSVVILEKYTVMYIPHFWIRKNITPLPPPPEKKGKKHANDTYIK